MISKFRRFPFFPFFKRGVHNQRVQRNKEGRGGTRGTPAALLTFSKSCASETADNLLPYFQEATYRVELEGSEMQLYSHRRELLCFVPSCFIRAEGEIYDGRKRERKENFKISNFQFNLVQLCFRSPPRHQPLKNALDMPTRRVKAGLENRSPSVLLSPPYPHLPLCNSRHG